jgi:tetratricopeptide (TPR) repeat protein
MTRPPRSGWQSLAVVACALGMACKESMVTAPIVVALFDRTFLFDSFEEAWRVRRRLYLGLAATWLLLIALLAQGPRPHSAGFSSGVSPLTYLLNQPGVIGRYLSLAVWPRSLVLLYGPPGQVTWLEALPSLVLILGLLALTIVAIWRWPKLGFLAACFWITLAPASSIVPIATEVAAERRMYLPLADLIVLATIGVARLLGVARDALPTRGSAPLVTFTAAVLVSTVSAAWASATVARNEEYSTPIAMARTVLERHPVPFSHLTLGRALLDAGERHPAMMHLEQALPLPGARFTLGMALLQGDRVNEGVAHLRAFVADQKPFLHEVVVARMAMGQLLMDQERWALAEREFRLILEALPGNPVAEHLLAEALFAQGLWEESLVHYRLYFGDVSNDAGALNNFGIALASTRQYAEAKAAFRRALEIDPANAPAERNLAAVLLGDRDFDEALAHAQRAVALQPENAGSHELLGRIWLSFGRLNEAEEQFNRALSLDPSLSDARDELELLAKSRLR